MSIDYRAVIAIGVEFYDKSEARSFIESSGYEFSDEDEEYIDDEGFWNWLSEHDSLGGGCLNLYSGDYGYVGYDISCRSPEDFKNSYDHAMVLWKENFKNEEPQVLKTVMVY